LGDLALALPFLREASRHARVTLLAKPHAAPLLRRFAPAVALAACHAPWTAFRGKYRLHRWPWRELQRLLRTLRGEHFDLAVSARPDPREHALLRLARPQRLIGFPRLGSGLLLSPALRPPASPHRRAHWQGIAGFCGWELPATIAKPAGGKSIVIHAGAAQPTRRWPRDRYEEIATRLRGLGWQVTLLDDRLNDLDQLLDTLAAADRFIGNDSGPGHLAALLGVPTFTLFGPALSAEFSPVHPAAAWLEGHPCRFKPCRDDCRFDRPHCLFDRTVDEVWAAVQRWLK
jgi:ADP-heptose:LPS heptosyltransferase